MHKIRPLRKKDKEDIKELFSQLVKNPAEFNHFQDWDIEPIINESNCHAIVVEYEGKAVGFASVIIFLTPVYGYKARIEDVIVHRDHRGKGLGKMLSQELIKIARNKKIKSIHLTSNPQRVAARKLYESLGFEQKDTGVFILNLNE
ncbi:MAG TPA: GNAT family N-acetyltransferase [Candidatus Moranbacteria bacterium]|nr:GNAT family N-acetyltransferase [Candidatus Moranbacteria bacterium]